MNDENKPTTERKTAPEVSADITGDISAVPDNEAVEPNREKIDLPEDDAPDVPDDLEITDTEDNAQQPKRNVFQRLWHGYGHHKKWTIPLTVLLLLAAAIAVPQSRYPLLSPVVKRDFTVAVLDTVTHQPVTNAEVQLNGVKQETDNHGRVHFHSKVGQGELKTSKKYYQTTRQDVLVTAWGKLPTYNIYLKATGRQVPVVVTNRITHAPIENALVRAAETEARTDKDGRATIVLPTGEATLAASISADGFNNLKADVTVTAKTVASNDFSLTPAGKVYFLSNLSGNIDVVKTNLDGTERQTVLAGTGNESDNDTTLMQSPDWKYLMLKAKREPTGAALYLIDTSNDKVITADEGEADFTPVGWSGHHFVYVINRHNIPNWKPYAQALKSYDAETGKVAIIDQTTGEGTNQFDYGYNSFSQVYLLGDELVYAKNWYGSGFAPNHLDGKHLQITSARADGGGKHTIKDFPVPDNTSYGYSADFSQFKYGALYVQIVGNGDPAYFVYENGTLTAKPDLNDDKFYARTYTPHYISADGSQTFWVENRDGKSAVFVGDKNGQNPKQVALLDGFLAYDWYGNDYILLFNKKSELFIMPSGGGLPVKITDFRLPDNF